MAILTMNTVNEKRLIMGTSQSSVTVRFNDVPKTVQVGPHYVVMSGYAEITPFPSATVLDVPMQSPAETREWEAQVVIGPVWRDVLECSPVIAPGSFFDSDNDENDYQGWHLKSGCSWDEVEVNGKKRIRLKFVMRQQGETSTFMGVVYHAAAKGYVTDMESMNFLT